MEQIAPLLEKSAAKLEVTVEYLWSILLFQARLHWIIPTIIVCIMLIIGIAFRHFKNQQIKIYESGGKNYDTKELIAGFNIASWAAYLVALIPAGFSIWYAFMAIVNPAYLALSKILSVLN